MAVAQGSFPLTPIHGTAWVHEDSAADEKRLGCILFLEGAPGWLEQVSGFRWSWDSANSASILSLSIEQRPVTIDYRAQNGQVSILGNEFEANEHNAFLVRAIDEEEPRVEGLGLHDLVFDPDDLPPVELLKRNGELRAALTGDVLQGSGSAAPSKAVAIHREALQLFQQQTKKGDKQALKLFKRAAKLGSANAEYGIGLCYQLGRGVGENLRKANDWYEKAAQNGQVDAQFKLGYSYLNGRGVKANVEQALFWYTKAADQGDIPTMTRLAYMYDTGDGLPSNEEQALVWYERAAQAGDLWSQYEMAKRHSKARAAGSSRVAYEWIRGLELQLTFIPPQNRAQIVDLAAELEQELPVAQRAEAEARAMARLVRQSAAKIRRMGSSPGDR